MPKTYSEQEHEYIKNRLKEEAAKCLSMYGVKRTTVDEIVQRVNIPKGTFYLFYKSKELLLWDVILEHHDKIETSLYDAIRKIDKSNDVKKQLTKVITDFYTLASKTPILRILDSSEVELLFRKLPPELVKKHFQHDNDMIYKAFSLLGLSEKIDVASFSAAFRAIYFATLHKEEIGEKQFEKALVLLVKGLVEQMIK